MKRIIKNYDELKTFIDHNREETTEETIEISALTALAVYRQVELGSCCDIKIISKYRTEHVTINKSAHRGIFD
jgi:predicted metal-dependent TIM-barrel fold hydrolase